LGRNKHYGKVLEDLEIETAAAEGVALARFDGRVVFVKGAVPGDVVDVRINGKKKKFLTAEILQIKKASDKRTTPVCSHFGVCGGCKWQNMDYRWQLHYKETQVNDAITRIGGLSGYKANPIMGSEPTFQYRNKMDFAFSHLRWLTKEDMQEGTYEGTKEALGFHVPARYDKVLQIEECHLMHPLHNRIRNRLFSLAIDKGISFYNLRQQEGVLRNVMLRNTIGGEWMLILMYRGEECEKEVEEVLTTLCDEFPQLSSVYVARNDKVNDAIYDLDLRLFKGMPYLSEKMDGLTFKIQPKSFFQTNPAQAVELYRKTLELAGLNKADRVYDLYCGTGTISLFMSRFCKEVIGVESVPQAIDDAHANAEMNGIDNCRFIVGDMKDVLTEDFFEQHGFPDCIITDPPRAGMHPKVVERLLHTACPKIVYVSCNPATQARDLAALSGQYELKEIQPVDMFPHTHHVENIALLQRVKHLESKTI
jgi:23S rRNA (uracil1939-C5)-methyltransferase